MHTDRIESRIKELRNLEARLHAYEHASGMLYLDGVTTAPDDTAEGRGATLEILAGEEYRLLVNDSAGELLEELTAVQETLDPQIAREVYMMKRRYDQTQRIPADEYTAYTRLTSDAQSVWQTAKTNNDFVSFQPYLQQLVDYNRRFAGYYNSEMAPYDALMNEYERGLNTQVLDSFFEQVKQTVVPLLERVTAAPQIEADFLNQSFPVSQQKELSDYLMEVLGINRHHCTIAETLHPFTINFNNRDVRITTHYLENNFLSSMYSVIHESGHALYELNVSDSLNGTCLGSGVSMGIHESQSRFYENFVGRSEAFITLIFPVLQQLFPSQLAGITPHALYRAVNRGEAGLIRTEADELTYSLHIIVRYEIEKQLIAGSLQAADVPDVWNTLYKSLLGVNVPNDAQGCLQDSHWAGGSFGYFPSYALGNAYGAQLLHVMQKDLDFYGSIAEGRIDRITAWLKERIHQYGSLYDPSIVLERACGAPFDPRYYTEYLTEKYSEIYNL